MSCDDGLAPFAFSTRDHLFQFFDVLFEFLALSLLYANLPLNLLLPRFVFRKPSLLRVRSEITWSFLG